MKRQELLDRLRPFAKGCFSSSLNEWIQLRKLLCDIYIFLGGVDEKKEEEKRSL